MARKIDARLSGLRSRRTGLDRTSIVNAFDSAELISNSYTPENYEKITASKPYTRYAIGAMQEVDERYTQISIEEAERVGKQLYSSLSNQGFLVGFKLQGSVPCNIHIRGVSDVDLLVLDLAFHTYDANGVKSKAGHYRNPISYTPISALQKLRAASEVILKEKYPSATIETSGGKAITLSGASLRRPVDIVPSHWDDTEAYQSSSREADRAIYILDKNIPMVILNKPFKHIEQISSKDAMCLGGLRKSIRLCKHIKADAEKEGTRISLPSFDIAAALWHADSAGLISGFSNELQILLETKRHLTYLHNNQLYTKSLQTPDGTRAIFDSESKLKGLELLLEEVNDLATEIAKEQNPLPSSLPYTWEKITETLKNSRIIY